MSTSPSDLTVVDAMSTTMSAREHARTLLDLLRPTIAFDGAWLAVVDPQGPTYRTLTSVDLSREVVDFLAGPAMARDIEITGTDQARPPLSPSDLDYPAEELSTWADCLMPAGLYEALAVGLFAPDGRHVGFLALLSGDRRPPTPSARRALQQVVPVLARTVDPMRSLTAAARLVRGATAAAVLHDDGSCDPLPGLPTDPALTPGSLLMGLCRDRLLARRPFSSFLWPVATHDHARVHTQVTVLAVPDDLTRRTTAVVVLSPRADLRGLTPRELEVLGLLVEGCANQEIARALTVAPRTVAAHVEHVLVKLDATSRTLAAVRAERDGLYVPSAALASPARSHLDAGRFLVGSARSAATVERSVRKTRSTSDACCVIDGHGDILSVNDAWAAFADSSAATRSGVGANYLEVCRASARDGAPMAQVTLDALENVVSERRASSWVIYPRAVPGELRWFRVAFSATGQSGHILVQHVDITAQLPTSMNGSTDDVVATTDGILTQAGFVLALDEWLTGPTPGTVVVLVTDCGRLPPQATAAAAFVGRVSVDLLAMLVVGEDAESALRTADAVIAATTAPESRGVPRWGVAIRADADTGATLLGRARRHCLRATATGARGTSE